MATLSEADPAERTLLAHANDWRQQAACRYCSPDLFFPAGTTGPAEHEVVAAKAVCSACPVQSACLLYALDTRQDFGIWGGTTQEERRLLRRSASSVPDDAKTGPGRLLTHPRPLSSSGATGCR